jgi:hypothetical protein
MPFPGAALDPDALHATGVPVGTEASRSEPVIRPVTYGAAGWSRRRSWSTRANASARTRSASGLRRSRPGPSRARAGRVAPPRPTRGRRGDLPRPQLAALAQEGGGLGGGPPTPDQVDVQLRAARERHAIAFEAAVEGSAVPRPDQDERGTPVASVIVVLVLVDLTTGPASSGQYHAHRELDTGET